jgi:hypothetical protein
MHIDHYPQMQNTNPIMIKKHVSNPKNFSMPKKVKIPTPNNVHIDQ